MNLAYLGVPQLVLGLVKQAYFRATGAGRAGLLHSDKYLACAPAALCLPPTHPTLGRRRSWTDSVRAAFAAEGAYALLILFGLLVRIRRPLPSNIHHSSACS